LLGTIMALVVAFVMKWFISIKEKSFFILELPTYRAPRWRNVGVTMLDKARIFVKDAGKVILVISIVLWALSTYGPPEKMSGTALQYEQLKANNPSEARNLERQKQAALLQNSYAGILGKRIEPLIEPLGFDWKIGIALITSFAAREVFVGTMATLYSVGEDEDSGLLLREKMHAATKDNGSPVYTVASGMSLMVFYVLAMQCMSTLAIVKRETRSWKWPAIQFLYMTALAYTFSFLVYQLFK
ncbi:MAG: ferrous iron transporter B, partial [Chitinophagaceae bacterium]|nr:ferrous iron transporter B [Chitinophagaceae bacterium]